MSYDNEQSPYTEVFSWGNDDSGQMGLGESKEKKNYNYPRFSSFSIVIHQISCGFEHAGFIAQNGFIYMMGSNENGRLGISNISIDYSYSPCLVETLSRYKALSIACGGTHSAAVVDSGELFTWGDDESLGLSNRAHSAQYSPQNVSLDHLHNQIKHVKQVSCGYNHTIFCFASGACCSFGNNQFGQLGLKDVIETSVPKLVENINEKVVFVSAGHQHSLFLGESAQVFACGRNTDGQLGCGNKRAKFQQVMRIDKLSSVKIVKIAAGQHSAAISDRGDLYLFGSCVFGEFLYPQKVHNLKIPAKEVSVGAHFGCVVDEEGQVYCWGRNEHGQLGLHDFDDRILPTALPSVRGKKIAKVSCGKNFVLALGETLQSYNTSTSNSEDNQQQQQITPLKRPSNNHYSLSPSARGSHSLRERTARRTPNIDQNQLNFEYGTFNLNQKNQLIEEVQEFLQKNRQHATQTDYSIQPNNAELHLIGNTFEKQENRPFATKGRYQNDFDLEKREHFLQSLSDNIAIMRKGKVVAPKTLATQQSENCDNQSIEEILMYPRKSRATEVSDNSQSPQRLSQVVATRAEAEPNSTEENQIVLITNKDETYLELSNNKEKRQTKSSNQEYTFQDAESDEQFGREANSRQILIKKQNDIGTKILQKKEMGIQTQQQPPDFNRMLEEKERRCQQLEASLHLANLKLKRKNEDYQKLLETNSQLENRLSEQEKSFTQLMRQLQQSGDGGLDANHNATYNASVLMEKTSGGAVRMNPLQNFSSSEVLNYTRSLKEQHQQNIHQPNKDTETNRQQDLSIENSLDEIMRDQSQKNLAVLQQLKNKNQSASHFNSIKAYSTTQFTPVRTRSATRDIKTDRQSDTLNGSSNAQRTLIGNFSSTDMGTLKAAKYQQNESLKIIHNLSDIRTKIDALTQNKSRLEERMQTFQEQLRKGPKQQ